MMFSKGGQLILTFLWEIWNNDIKKKEREKRNRKRKEQRGTIRERERERERERDGRLSCSGEQGCNLYTGRCMVSRRLWVPSDAVAVKPSRTRRINKLGCLWRASLLWGSLIFDGMAWGLSGWLCHLGRLLPYPQMLVWPEKTLPGTKRSSLLVRRMGDSGRKFL